MEELSTSLLEGTQLMMKAFIIRRLITTRWLMRWRDWQRELRKISTRIRVTGIMFIWLRRGTGFHRRMRMRLIDTSPITTMKRCVIVECIERKNKNRVNLSRARVGRVVGRRSKKALSSQRSSSWILWRRVSATLSMRCFRSILATTIRIRTPCSNLGVLLKMFHSNSQVSFLLMQMVIVLNVPVSKWINEWMSVCG